MSESGAASIIVQLRNGDITIYHGEDNVILQHFSRVADGTWGDMFDTIVQQLREKEEN